jgi:DNA-binding transcriptional ArsR family regulator
VSGNLAEADSGRRSGAGRPSREFGALSCGLTVSVEGGASGALTRERTDRSSLDSPEVDSTAGSRHLPIWVYDRRMARAATTSDVFNAIAEPRRREILTLLRTGERPVAQLALELGLPQPGASKHLRVLREVGLVRDRREGKQRVYGLDAGGLRAVHEWTGGFERFWNESFDRLDAYVQELKQERHGEK